MLTTRSKIFKDVSLIGGWISELQNSRVVLQIIIEDSLLVSFSVNVSNNEWLKLNIKNMFRNKIMINMMKCKKLIQIAGQKFTNKAIKV